MAEFQKKDQIVKFSDELDQFRIDRRGVTGSDIDNGCVYHIMSRVVPAGVSSLEIELKMCCLGLKMKLTRLFCVKAI